MQTFEQEYHEVVAEHIESYSHESLREEMRQEDERTEDYNDNQN